MWNQIGRPGTPFSLVLKMLQGIFSLTSIINLVLAIRLKPLQFFRVMILTTFIGGFWSIAMFCFYMVLMIKHRQVDRGYLVFFVVGDLIALFVHLLSAMQGLGPTIHFVIDTKRCVMQYPKECKHIFLAIELDMAAWFCAFISFIFVLRHRISRRGRQ